MISAAGDAVALAALVGAQCVPRLGPLLLLSGAGQGMGLAASLRRRGFRVIRRVVYVARPMSHVGDVGPVDVALFFSAASAHAFVRRWTGDASAITAIAISAATEAALTPLKWARIRVASQPNQDAMLALLS